MLTSVSDEMGRDKDVTKDVSAFMAYKRSGTVEVSCTLLNTDDICSQKWTRLFRIIHDRYGSSNCQMGTVSLQK
jgi:hypothetical protein